MKVFINGNNEIKDVNTTTDDSLRPIEMPKDNPFANWSVAKICCHKVDLKNGQYAGFTPYVDSRVIEHIERLGKENEATNEEVTDTQLALAETYEQTMAIEDAITDVELALTEIYERML